MMNSMFYFLFETIILEDRLIDELICLEDGLINKLICLDDGLIDKLICEMMDWLTSWFV